jgi:hypothetical protein
VATLKLRHVTGTNRKGRENLREGWPCPPTSHLSSDQHYALLAARRVVSLLIARSRRRAASPQTLTQNRPPAMSSTSPTAPSQSRRVPPPPPPTTSSSTRSLGGTRTRSPRTGSHPTLYAPYPRIGTSVSSSSSPAIPHEPLLPTASPHLQFPAFKDVPRVHSGPRV